MLKLLLVFFLMVGTAYSMSIIKIENPCACPEEPLSEETKVEEEEEFQFPFEISE